MEPFDAIPEDAKLLASPEDYKRFTQSLVWTDIQRFFLDRIEVIRDDLENAKNWEHVVALKAEAQSVRVMLGLPEYLHEEATKLTQLEARHGRQE